MTSELKGLSNKQMRDFMSIKGANKLKRTYEKQGGKGFSEDVWKGILNTGKNVNDFLKNTKIISKAGKLAKFVLPAIAGVIGPEVLAGIPIAEKIGSTAESLGYGGCSNMNGGAWNIGLTQLGTGSENVLTVSRNGTFQVTNPTHLSSPGVGFLGDNSRVDAGAPQLSNIMSGLGSLSNKDALGQYFTIHGKGLGSFNVISSDSRIKI